MINQMILKNKNLYQNNLIKKINMYLNYYDLKINFN